MLIDAAGYRALAGLMQHTEIRFVYHFGSRHACLTSRRVVMPPIPLTFDRNDPRHNFPGGLLRADRDGAPLAERTEAFVYVGGS